MERLIHPVGVKEAEGPVVMTMLGWVLFRGGFHEDRVDFLVWICPRTRVEKKRRRAEENVRRAEEKEEEERGRAREERRGGEGGTTRTRVGGNTGSLQVKP